MRVTEAKSYYELRNSIAFDYIDFFEKLGYLVILIPNNTDNIEKYFDKDIDLIVLTGGNNLDPSLYDGEKNLDDIYPIRDKCEKTLFDIASKRGIKVLGICRGFQTLNVFLGGSISHNLPNHVNTKHKLSSYDKDLDSQITNSFHNHSIMFSNLGNWGNVTPLATTQEGFIEAILNDKKNYLGIQWHPERQDNDFDKKIIEKFLKGAL